MPGKIHQRLGEWDSRRRPLTVAAAEAASNEQRRPVVWFVGRTSLKGHDIFQAWGRTADKVTRTVRLK